MSKTLFPWNGECVGEIKELITQQIQTSKGILLTFTDSSKAYVSKYSSIPIISDQLKFMFELDKIGRCSCFYFGKHAMLHRVSCEEYNFNLVKDPINIDDIKKSLLFRWFLGLTLTCEKSLCVRKYKSGINRVTSLIENKYDYFNVKPYVGSDLSSFLIKKWFDDDLTIIAKKMLSPYSIIELRKIIHDTIKKIDPENMIWGFYMLNRMSQFIDH